MAKTRVRIPKIDMKAFLIYLRKVDACDEAINWVKSNRNKTPKELLEALNNRADGSYCNSGDWYYWLKSELGMGQNATFEQVMKELAKAIKEYTPAGIKKTKEADAKILTDVKDWLKDAKALLEKAKRSKIYYHLDISDIQDELNRLDNKYNLHNLVMDIKDAENQ